MILLVVFLQLLQWPTGSTQQKVNCKKILEEDQTALIQDLPGAITQRILENNGAIPVTKQDMLASIAEARNKNNHFDAAVPDIIMSASSDSGGLYDTWNWAKDSHDYVRFHPVPIDFEFPM